MSYRVKHLETGSFFFGPPSMDMYEDTRPRDLWYITTNERLEDGFRRVRGVSWTRPTAMFMDCVVSGDLGIAEVEPDEVTKLTKWARREHSWFWPVRSWLTTAWWNLKRRIRRGLGYNKKVRKEL